MNRNLDLNILYGTLAPVDVLAVGPHPDDIEIGAAGSLLSWRDQGYRIGLLDLTRGELGTKGDAETRLDESVEAARRLGAEFRVNLELPDGGVSDDEPSREKLVAAIRLSKPAWVLSNLEEDQHPDHASGGRLVKSAFFLSRLPKYLTEVPAHSPERLAHYLIHTQTAPTFLADIGSVFERKFEVLEAYASQFVEARVPEGYRHTGLSDYLRNIRALGEAWGVQGGVEAAEAFVSSRPLVLGSPRDVLTPSTSFAHTARRDARD